MSARRLADWQRAFRRHLLEGDVPELIAASVGGRIGAAARLRIHRHHVAASLTAALGATFSTVRGVVGDAFFGDMARAFIVASPPSAPVLSEYGAGFADFVAAWPAASTLPYLADVARLDWALTVAANAPDAPALTAQHLAAIPPAQLADLAVTLRGGVGLVVSPYPLDHIWRMNHGDGIEAVDLGDGGCSLLVYPRAGDAAFVALEGGTAALAAALCHGHALGVAAESAMEAEPGLDIGSALGTLLALRALADS